MKRKLLLLVLVFIIIVCIFNSKNEDFYDKEPMSVKEFDAAFLSKFPENTEEYDVANGVLSLIKTEKKGWQCIKGVPLYFLIYDLCILSYKKYNYNNTLLNAIMGEEYYEWFEGISSTNGRLYDIDNDSSNETVYPVNLNVMVSISRNLPKSSSWLNIPSDVLNDIRPSVRAIIKVYEDFGLLDIEHLNSDSRIMQGRIRERGDLIKRFNYNLSLDKDADKDSISDTIKSFYDNYRVLPYMGFKESKIEKYLSADFANYLIKNDECYSDYRYKVLVPFFSLNYDDDAFISVYIVYIDSDTFKGYSTISNAIKKGLIKYMTDPPDWPFSIKAKKEDPNAHYKFDNGNFAAFKTVGDRKLKFYPYF